MWDYLFMISTSKRYINSAYQKGAQKGEEYFRRGIQDFRDRCRSEKGKNTSRDLGEKERDLFLG